MRRAASELRRRLRFLEAVLRALGGVQDEDQGLRQVVQLAIAHFASASWIFLRGSTGTIRLAQAARAGAARAPAPAGLRERAAAMLKPRARRRAADRDDSAISIVLLEHEGQPLGALAFLPRGPPSSSRAWEASMLAVQASSALVRARARARLRYAVHLRDDVFAAAAHELGNSLAAIALQVRALLSDPSVHGSGSPLAPRLDAMEVQIQRLMDLNHRMLDSSRLARGKFPLRLTNCDAAQVVREVLARNADELAWRRCHLDFSDPGPLPGRWDRGLLDQIFSNLLSNAMKYGHGRPISIALQGDPKSVELRVEDHGIGIAPQHHRRIFEKFERAAPLELGTSLGIGLWLVQRMTRRLGGTVHLTSTPGRGSIFTVKLPRKAPARRPSREVST